LEAWLLDHHVAGATPVMGASFDRPVLPEAGIRLSSV
jgi:hypothetical protein